MPKIECIEDVVMNGDDKKVAGKVAFTKGKVYKMYRSNLRDWYDIIPVMRARNNWNEPHIIKYASDDKLNHFFDKHFKIL